MKTPDCDMCGRETWHGVKPAGSTAVKYLTQGLCSSCYSRKRKAEKSGKPLLVRSMHKNGRDDDFREDYNFLKTELNLHDADVAARMGIEVDTLYKRLNRLEGDQPEGMTAYERQAWQWIEKYQQRAERFTTDSLPFTDDPGLHSKMINRGLRMGVIRDTGETRRSIVGKGINRQVFEGVPSVG